MQFTSAIESTVSVIIDTNFPGSISINWPSKKAIGQTHQKHWVITMSSKLMIIKCNFDYSRIQYIHFQSSVWCHYEIDLVSDMSIVFNQIEELKYDRVHVCSSLSENRGYFPFSNRFLTDSALSANSWTTVIARLSGLSFVNSKSGQIFAFEVVLCAISCYIVPRYIGSL